MTSVIRRLVRLFLRLVGRSRSWEVEDDIRTHLELDAERLRSGGLSPTEAWERAHQRFGDVERIRGEMHRAARSDGRPPRLHALTMLHLPGAFRSLVRTPAASLAVVLTLGLAVGAVVATLTVGSGILRSDGGVRDPDRIAAVHVFYPTLPDGMREQPLHPTWIDDLEALDGVEAVAAFKGTYLNWTEAPEPRRLDGIRITPGFLQVAKVRPALGPGFQDVETGDERVAMISWDFWQEGLGGAPDVVGSVLRLDGIGHQVVGVLPEGFAFPRRADVPPTFRFPSRPDVWVPYALPERGPSDLGALLRLGSGGTMEELRGSLGRLAESFPSNGASGAPPFEIRAQPLLAQATGDLRPILFLLLGATGLVFLVAVANVTGTGVARGLARRAEGAVRLTLGAGGRGLAALALAEVIAVASAATVVALTFGSAVLSVTRAVAPPEVPGMEEAGIGVVGVAGAVLLAFLGALPYGGAGVVDWIRRGASAHASAVAQVLRSPRASASRSTVRVTRALIAGEVALTLLLLAGTALLTTTVANLLSVELGLRPESVVTAEITLPESVYPDRERALRIQRAQAPPHDGEAPVLRFHSRVLDILRSSPGVSSAGVVSPLPFKGQQEASAYWVRGMDPARAIPIAEYTVVSDGALDALGVRLVEGRLFDSGDRYDTEPVAIVNEALARSVGVEAMLGSLIHLGGPESPQPRLRVVGIIGDFRRTTLRGAPRPEILVPVSQGGFTPLSTMHVVVSGRDPASARSLAAPIRSAVAEVDPNVPVASVATLTDLVSRAASRERFTARVAGGFGLLALLIACLGLYASVSFAVGTRRKELAIRLAVGASSARVFGLAMVEALVPLGAGIVAGVALLAAASGLLSRTLFGVAPLDPGILATAIVIVGVTGLAAGSGPASRTIAIDPARELAGD